MSLINEVTESQAKLKGATEIADRKSSRSVGFIIVFTDLNSTSLILALQRSENDSPSLIFVYFPSLLHSALCIIQVA